jgi:hypothetical protein
MAARALRFALLAAAIAAMTGAQWAALQCVAWTGMLAQNLGVYSVNEAVCRTFDGQHPCRLCQAVAAGKRSEQQAEPTLTWSKFPVPPARLAAMPPVPLLSHLLPRGAQRLAAVVRKPPLPPPRGWVA